MGKEKEHGRKPRNKNFTATEKRVLAGFVKDNSHTLFGKAGHCSQKVETRKKKCWQKAAETLRIAGGPQSREWRDVRKKWNELKVQAHKYQQKKTATGGGPVAVDECLEHVLDSLSPQAKFGICGQETETHPLPSESEEENSQSQSQESQVTVEFIPNSSSSSSSVYKNCSSSNNNSNSSNNKSNNSSNNKSNNSSNNAVLDKKQKAQPSSSRRLEEELLQVEHEKVALMKETLDVHRGILECLQSLTSSTLLNSLQ